MSPRGRQTLARAVMVSVIGLVLAWVTLMYLQPDFMLTMAQQIWACF